VGPGLGQAQDGKKETKGGVGKLGPTPDPSMKPTVPIAEQFKGKSLPLGEIQEYSKSTHGLSNEELKARDALQEETYVEIRQAAEAHRQTRRYMQNYIKPGMSMIQICEELEGTARHLIQENGLTAGLAFPTGCSLNNVAAHYTPNNGDTLTIGYDDVCKVDFGVHVNGEPPHPSCLFRTHCCCVSQL